MTVVYDWKIRTHLGEFYKFYHSDVFMTEEHMKRTILATEVDEYPDCAILLLEPASCHYKKCTIRGQIYHVVPFDTISSLRCDERRKEVEHLQLFDEISSICGEK